LMIHENINSRLPEGISFKYGIVTIQSGKGKQFLETVAGDRKWLGYYFNVGVVLLFLNMVAGATLVVASAITTLVERPEPTGTRDPANAVLVPGVSDLVPFEAVAYVTLTLFITVSVHEIGHGLAAVYEDYEYEGFGLIMFLFVPVGAFVKMDEIEEYGPRLRVLSAGVLNNYVVAIAAWLGFSLIDSSLFQLWESYIVAMGQGPDTTAAVVAHYSPTANILFWLVFLGINLAVINSLPIIGLDGGKYFKTLIDWVAEWTGVDSKKLIGMELSDLAFLFVSISGAGLLAVSIAGPALL
jgi:membrane-associated protease RseP (regulator of RpoE activity)